MIKKYVNKVNAITGIKLTENNIKEVIDFICNGETVEKIFKTSYETVEFWTKSQKRLYFTNKGTKYKALFGDTIINTGEGIYPIKQIELDKNFLEVM